MEYNLKHRNTRILYKNKPRWLIVSVAMLGMLGGFAEAHANTHAAPVSNNYKPVNHQLGSVTSQKDRLMVPNYNQLNSGSTSNNNGFSSFSNSNATHLLEQSIKSLSPSVSTGTSSNANNSEATDDSNSAVRGTYDLTIIKKDPTNKYVINSKHVYVPIKGAIHSIYDINYKNYAPAGCHLAIGSLPDQYVGINGPNSISEDHGSFTYDKDYAKGMIAVDYVDNRTHQVVKSGEVNGYIGDQVNLLQKVSMPSGYRYVKGDQNETIETPRVATIWVQKESNGNNQPSNNKPTNPIKPNNPTSPTKPTNPVKPNNPTSPTKPTNPVKPNNPTSPTKPTNPIKPNNPTSPTKPTNSNQPSNSNSASNQGPSNNINSGLDSNHTNSSASSHANQSNSSNSNQDNISSSANNNQVPASNEANTSSTSSNTSNQANDSSQDSAEDSSGNSSDYSSDSDDSQSQSTDRGSNELMNRADHSNKNIAGQSNGSIQSSDSNQSNNQSNGGSLPQTGENSHAVRLASALLMLDALIYDSFIVNRRHKGTK